MEALVTKRLSSWEDAEDISLCSNTPEKWYELNSSPHNYG